MRGARAAILIAVGLTLPAAAFAQVMEIAGDGQVTVYDRPAVFEAGGVTAIETSKPAAIRAGPRTQAAGPILAQAAQAARLSPRLVEAVAWRESRMRPGVVSRAGAVGEMQLMPFTARSLGVDPFDSAQNYRGGALYLGSLLNRYRGDLILALAAYNAGPGAVDRWRGVPPYRETQDYVAAIMDRLSQRVPPFVEPFAER